MNNINYFENEYFKIKIYNSKYNDKFSINYSNNIITITRIDNSNGWGQNLQLIFREKLLYQDKIINIGSSKDNIKTLIYDYDYSLIDNLPKFHYEDDNYKIFYVSEEFNDVFKIDYDNILNKLIIKRLDSLDGWGQILKLRINNKHTLNEQIINIGSSKKNLINIDFNINTKIYDNYPNYFENDNYILKIIDNIYTDQFSIIYYEESETIFIKRLDKNEGWGQNLKINIIHKNLEYSLNKIIYILILFWLYKKYIWY